MEKSSKTKVPAVGTSDEFGKIINEDRKLEQELNKKKLKKYFYNKKKKKKKNRCQFIGT